MQIAYHRRQKSPLHFATSHDTLQQSQLHTLCQKTHNFSPCPAVADPVGISPMCLILVIGYRVVEKLPQYIKQFS